MLTVGETGWGVYENSVLFSNLKLFPNKKFILKRRIFKNEESKTKGEEEEVEDEMVEDKVDELVGSSGGFPFLQRN